MGRPNQEEQGLTSTPQISSEQEFEIALERIGNVQRILEEGDRRLRRGQSPLPPEETVWIDQSSENISSYGVFNFGQKTIWEERERELLYENTNHRFLYEVDKQTVNSYFFLKIRRKIVETLQGFTTIYQNFESKYGGLNPEEALQPGDILDQLISLYDEKLLIDNETQSLERAPSQVGGTHTIQQGLFPSLRQPVSSIPINNNQIKKTQWKTKVFNEHPILFAINSWSNQGWNTLYENAKTRGDFLEKRKLMNFTLNDTLSNILHHSLQTDALILENERNPHLKKFSPIVYRLIEELCEDTFERAYLKRIYENKARMDIRHWTTSDWILTLSVIVAIASLPLSGGTSATAIGLARGLGFLSTGGEIFGFILREKEQDQQEVFNQLQIIDESLRIMGGDQNDSFEVLLSLGLFFIGELGSEALRTLQTPSPRTTSAPSRVTRTYEGHHSLPSELLTRESDPLLAVNPNAPPASKVRQAEIELSEDPISPLAWQRMTYRPTPPSTLSDLMKLHAQGRELTQTITTTNTRVLMLGDDAFTVEVRLSRSHFSQWGPEMIDTLNYRYRKANVAIRANRLDGIDARALSKQHRGEQRIGQSDFYLYDTTLRKDFWWVYQGKVTGRFDVDEVLSRMWGGRQDPRFMMPLVSEVNQELGRIESEALFAVLLNQGEGKLLLGFEVVWVP
ncbi:MAG: hypothetical protein CL678_11040 [Bdellovibrionaceae bacterium]|nr:hypothetical protein [Pseudobdellovibrionaceae bacterium]|tara:strand:- start:378 stop:2420 length:2043 start_codon:yes stop_codon:yes gene_type:complete